MRRGAPDWVRRLWWVPTLLGALVLLWPSWTGRTDLLPTDIQQQFLPWSAAEDAPQEADNPLLRDQVDTYAPEQATVWDRLFGPGDPGWLEGAGMGAPGWWFVGGGSLSPFVAAEEAAAVPEGLSAVLRLTLAGAGLGLALRRWGGSPWAAAVASGAFAFSGFMIAWLGWPQSHVGAAVGWVWWATTVAVDPDPPWWAVPALAVATTVAWLGGFPAVTAFLLVTAAGLATARAWQLRSWEGLARAGGGLAVGTTLAAVTLLPSVSYLSAVNLTGRTEAWRGGLPVELAIRWLLPDAFGDGVTAPYWGQANLVETAAYVGIPAVLLAVLALATRIGRPIVAQVAVLTGLLTLVVYGFTPVSRLLRFLPGLGSNPPSRAVVLVGAGVAVLAGFGLDALRDRVRPTRAGIATVAGLSAVVVGIVVVVRPDRRIAEVANDRLVDPDVEQAARQLLAQDVQAAALLIGVAVLAGMAVWWLHGRGVATGLALAVMTVLVIADPLLQAAGWNTQVEPGTRFPPAPEVAALAAEVPPPGRVAAPDRVLLPMTDLRYPFDDARGRRFLTAELQAVILAAGGDLASPTRWTLEEDPASWTPAVGALGVEGVAVAAGADGPDGWDRQPLGAIDVLAVPEPVPWISVATDVRQLPIGVVPSALASRTDPDIAYVDTGDVGLLPAAVRPGSTPAEPAEVEQVQVDGRHIRAHVDAADGAVLRVLEANLPGWSATIDGVPADLVAVDAAFVGVVIPPGGGTVELRWIAPWLAAGWVVSVVSGIALLAYAFHQRRGARWHRGDDHAERRFPQGRSAGGPLAPAGHARGGGGGDHDAPA